jgi:hypothetical protein
MTQLPAPGEAHLSPQVRQDLADALVAWAAAAQGYSERCLNAEGGVLDTFWVATMLNGLAGLALMQPLAAATPAGREQVAGGVLLLLKGSVAGLTRPPPPPLGEEGAAEYVLDRMRDASDDTPAKIAAMLAGEILK